MACFLLSPMSCFTSKTKAAAKRQSFLTVRSGCNQIGVQVQKVLKGPQERPDIAENAHKRKADRFTLLRRSSR